MLIARSPRSVSGALTLVASKKAKPFNATISRSGGTGFYSDASSVRNIYKIRFMNKRNQSATGDHPAWQGHAGRLPTERCRADIHRGALEEMSRTCVVIAPVDAYTGPTDMFLKSMPIRAMSP
jgi:hypothetical protein